jgi:MFS family permease
LRPHRAAPQRPLLCTPTHPPGHIGDHIGRRVSLLLSILLMALPTILVGCLPSYQTIGIAAPILMALLRVVQGLAVGGEYG